MMKEPAVKGWRRREFIGSLGAAAIFASARSSRAGQQAKLEAGEGCADITPPVGIELGGFHRPPGQERRVRGIRQAATVRALVLRCAGTETVLVSADICGIGRDMAERLQKKIQQATGIPAANVRLCATHTHSMPAFCYLRQWGALPREFMVTVEKRIVAAVLAAVDDLAPAELHVGSSCVEGGNFNRTTAAFKTDQDFHDSSNEQERWLDTTLQAMLFRRTAGHKDLVWYHFSAHPVCFADEQAGPDWPGMVADRLMRDQNLNPSLLQGHAGDVNPGDGTPWRGDAQETTQAVYAGLQAALAGVQKVQVDHLACASQPFGFSLDMQRFQAWLDAYARDPAQCVGGPWVDAGFAKAWYDDNRSRDKQQDKLTRQLSALQIGNVGLLFHPSELYSYYGLAIRRDSPFDMTLVVGYTDGMIGYLTDRQAFAEGEYAALTVPKILDYPPFTPAAAAEMSAASVALLSRVAAG